MNHYEGDQTTSLKRRTREVSRIIRRNQPTHNVKEKRLAFSRTQFR